MLFAVIGILWTLMSTLVSLRVSTKAPPQKLIEFSHLSREYFHSLVATRNFGFFCAALVDFILNIIIILYIDMKRIISLLFILIYKHVQDIPFVIGVGVAGELTKLVEVPPLEVNFISVVLLFRA